MTLNKPIYVTVVGSGPAVDDYASAARSVAVPTLVRTCTDLDSVADSADADLVVLAEPEVLTSPFAKRALGRGAHILWEWPPYWIPATMRDLVALAEAQGRILRFAFPERYAVTAEHLGEIGTIRRVEARWSLPPEPDGVVPRDSLLSPTGLRRLAQALSCFPAATSGRLEAVVPEGDEQVRLDITLADGGQVTLTGRRERESRDTMTITGDRAVLTVPRELTRLAEWRRLTLGDTLRDLVGPTETITPDDRLFLDVIAALDASLWHRFTPDRPTVIEF